MYNLIDLVVLQIFANNTTTYVKFAMISLTCHDFKTVIEAWANTSKIIFQGWICIEIDHSFNLSNKIDYKTQSIDFFNYVIRIWWR